MSTIEPFRLPESVPDCDCTLCLRKGVPLPIVEAPMMFAAYQIVKVDENDQSVPLTEAELKQFEEEHSRHAEWTQDVKQTYWWKTCNKMVKHLLRDKEAGPFKKPVDVVALNIPDYPLIIKHPMDLGTIDQKLNANPCQYSSPDQFVNDVRTVFRNCLVYNSSATAVYKMAEGLSRKFEEQVASYCTVSASALES